MEKKIQKSLRRHRFRLAGLLFKCSKEKVLSLSVYLRYLRFPTTKWQIYERIHQLNEDV